MELPFGFDSPSLLASLFLLLLVCPVAKKAQQDMELLLLLLLLLLLMRMMVTCTFNIVEWYRRCKHQHVDLIWNHWEARNCRENHNSSWILIPDSILSNAHCKKKRRTKIDIGVSSHSKSLKTASLNKARKKGSCHHCFSTIQRWIPPSTMEIRPLRYRRLSLLHHRSEKPAGLFRPGDLPKTKWCKTFWPSVSALKFP